MNKGLKMNLQLFAEPSKKTVEELQADMVKMGEELKKVTEQLKTQTEVTKEKDERIKQLIDINQDYYLKITKDPKTEKGSEGDNQEIPFVLDKKTFELLSDKDIEKLEELMEVDE